MADKRITYREEPRGPWLLWATAGPGFRYCSERTGALRGNAAIRAAALDLKRELRETHPRALVAVDGHNVNGE